MRLGNVGAVLAVIVAIVVVATIVVVAGREQ